MRRSDLRDIVSQSLRFASATGTEWPLDFLLRTLNVEQLREDRDFIGWDRVCRVLSSGKQAARFDALGTWANILSQWSLCSTQPELARLRREAAARCYDQVLQAEEASSRQKAQALYNRGVTYGRMGDSEREIADYTAVLQMPDAPAEQKAQALVNRGVTYGQGGDSERAIADYTAVLQMPDAPAEQKAQALVNRGVTYGQAGRFGAGDRRLHGRAPDARRAGRTEGTGPRQPRRDVRASGAIRSGQIADYTAVLQMPDAPAEQKAKALVNRGVTYGQAGRFGAGDRRLHGRAPDARRCRPNKRRRPSSTAA